MHIPLCKVISLRRSYILRCDVSPLMPQPLFLDAFDVLYMGKVRFACFRHNVPPPTGYHDDEDHHACSSSI